MICQACENIFGGNFEPETPRFNHHHNPNELELAVLEGCYICDVLWRRYQYRKASPSTQSSQTIKANSLVSSQDGKNNFTMYQLDTSVESGVLELSMLVNIYFDLGAKLSVQSSSICTFYLRPTSALDHLGKSAITINNSDPIPSMAIAKGWLENCCRRHAQCHRLNTKKSKRWKMWIKLRKSEKPNSSNLQLPARLLEIGAPTFDRVRLWFPSKNTSLLQTVSYMTLSHCWGSAQFLTLTQSSLPRLEAGIFTSELPKSFQDAIHITRELGVRFLWIDSLCILQDSVSDWQQEAALMADVYRGSLCNIAATGASDANVGCLYLRTSPPKPCVVKSSWGDVANDEYLIYDQSFWISSFENDPLRQRAWVVQELLLSPRILHMGKTQMYWECYESKACEYYPDGFPGFIGFLTEKKPLEETELGGVGGPALVQDWRNILRTYTSCKLTKSEDKLIAISGVVKVLQKSTGDKYFAGLWGEHLATDLLWEKSLSQPTGLMPAKIYRAPSWSWASVDGRIGAGFRVSEEEISIAILDVSVQAAGNDLTGAVTSGRIKLSGPLITVHIGSEDLAAIEVGWLTAEYPLTFIRRDKTTVTRYRRVAWSSDIRSGNLHCLPVRYRPDYSVKENREYDCLLLSPTNLQRGEFYRWGTVSLFSSTFDDAGTHDWFEYEDHDGNGNYTISII